MKYRLKMVFEHNFWVIKVKSNRLFSKWLDIGKYKDVHEAALYFKLHCYKFKEFKEFKEFEDFEKNI